MNNSEILLYQTEDGQTKIDVRLEEETVWLTIEQMSHLFQKSRSTINEHIINIYNEGELEKEPTLRKIGISDFSTKPTNNYNLDVIISVGYRVKSHQGTKFRQWATSRPKEYIVKGFTMNAGTISHKKALQKAHLEYKKYKELRKNEISEVEKDFIKQISNTAKELKDKK